MPIEQIVAKLERRYPHLERVTDAVFRAVDLYDGRPYAIRYFDLTDDVGSAAGQLHDYQNRLLSASYYNSESKADLRWNHYIYFFTSAPVTDTAFAKAKVAVESDREYARKLVVTEAELDRILDERSFGVESAEGLPPDALSIWTDTLEKHNLGFIVDETLQVPAIVRHIAEGERKPVLRPPVTPQLDPAEQAVSTDFLAGIAIREFRKYPIQKTFDFGAVNLILGVNGVGKTSLFEAIEYLFCGKTRRAGSVLPRTVISGVLANSKLTLQTKTTTSQATLRSRHLVWYGKSELRTLTLHDSFSKFNFLDTDAAARLSVEKSRERIIDDLAQLLLGAEASKALDRFERVTRQLSESKKTLETDITIRDSRRAESAGRIQLLRDAPRESDALFSDLLAAVESVGWRQLPTDKSHVDRLSGSIQSALVNVTVLGSAGDPISANVGELDATIKSVTDAERTIDRLSEEEAARKREDAQAHLRLQELEKRIDALEALVPVVAAGVGELHRKRQALERQLRDRAASLAAAEAVAPNLPSDKSHRRKMLLRVVTEWAEMVRAAAERLDTAQKRLAAFERTQNLLSSLQQRLRSSAEEIIEHTGDATHCPLCRAEYSQGELAKRFEEAARGIVTDESDRLRLELQNAEAAHKQGVSELTALRALERYVTSDRAKISLDVAIRAVTNERDQLAALTSELEATTTALRAKQDKGATFERLIQLASAAGIPESEVSSDRIEVNRAATRDEQKRLLDTIRKLDVDAQNARSRLSEIGIAYGLDKPSLGELARAVSQRKRQFEDRRRAITALGDSLNLAAIASVSELEARLREAQDLAVRLRTAVAKEQQDSEVIQRELKLVDDAVAEIEGLRVKLRRVDSADAVLQDLLGQQSERLLAATVLRENAATIASTFAKIHAPNEFDLVVNGGLTIIRRGGGNVELDEMSSGQRAAYALSLFLAMNERLKIGPKVLLFDDPVAHVDDINTLSLLDHLRDIALTGQRQIFFATADSKIGALFGRKFRFLGESFRQIELSRD
jgi:DNA repair protein SbcC/Rad50